MYKLCTLATRQIYFYLKAEMSSNAFSVLLIELMTAYIYGVLAPVLSALHALSYWVL